MKNLKEIDFKQFLLEKGERVGIGVAVAVMLLLVILGLLSIRAGSPVEKEKALTDVAQRVDNLLRTAQPTAADKPDPNASQNLIDLDTRQTQAEEYQIADLFSGRQQESPTRRPPEILAADEGVVDTALMNFDTYDLRFDQATGMPTEMWFLKDVKSTAATTGGTGALGGGGGLFGGQGLQGLGLRGGMGGMPLGPGMGGSGAGGPPMGGSGAMGPPRGGSGSGAGMMGGPGMMGGNMSAFMQGQNQVQTLEEIRPHARISVPIRDVSKKAAGLTPVRQLRPLRMAVIAASFPYRKQIEKFQEALHLNSPQEVFQETIKDPKEDKPVSAFRFTGVRVQRRELDSTGKPTRDWQDIDLGAAYRPWLVVTGRRFEPENPKYAAISFTGLVMRPLLQFRDKPESAPAEPAADDIENHYPMVEAKLKNIQETLEALKSKDPAEIAKPPEQFNPDSAFDPFNPSAQIEKPAAAGGAGNPMGGAAGAQQTIPEHCLIRLIDLTIEPGKTYQYRIQVRMANPNYKRPDVANPDWANSPELVSDKWYEIPERAKVPPELRYYAVDQEELDMAEGKKYTGINTGYVPFKDRQTVLQIHRWLGAVKIDKLGREPLMIGEWAVADRVPVYRGEYADKKVRLELPVWSPIHNAFLIPTDQDGRRNRKPGIEVNFSHDLDGRETVLVDFDGGKETYTQSIRNGDDEPKRVTIEDSSSTDVLLMTPEGKLLGHNSGIDSQDLHRKEQRENAMRRVDHVRHGKPDPQNQPKKNDPFGTKSGG